MKKIVIKIGRTIATSKRNKIDRYRFEQLAKQIKMLHAQGISVVLVVSAAVCCGEQELAIKGLYDLSKSLVAGVGQTVVMGELYNIFRKHSLKIGQLLLTKSDIKNEQKRATIRTVLFQAAERGITVIINENDIVELHSFGGNDYLAAEIAKIVQADSLVFFTDVDGVFNGKLELMKEYSHRENLAQITKVNTKGAVGGMGGKIDAALLAVSQGITTWIVSGKTQNLLVRMFLKNEHIGTKMLGGNV